KTSATSMAWCSPGETHRDELFVPLSGSYFLLAGRGLALDLGPTLGLGLQLRSCRLLANHGRKRFRALAPLRQHDFDMRDAPHVAERPAHRCRTDAFHPWPIVGHRGLHV